MIHTQIKNNSRQEKRVKAKELNPSNACRPDVKWSK